MGELNKDLQEMKRAAFWSQKYRLWLTPLKQGRELPEGAKVLSGKQGGSYYYDPDNQPKPPEKQGNGIKQPKLQPGQAPNAEQPAQAPQNPDAAPGLYMGGLLGDQNMEDLPVEQRLEQPWRQGKIAVKIPGRGAQWMLPEQFANALSAGKPYELDEARNEEHGVRLPTPEDPDRMHVHDGAMQPHKVNEVHNDNEDADIAHRDEVDRFDRAFNPHLKAAWLDQYNVQITDTNENGRPIIVNLKGVKYEASKYTANGMKGPVYSFDTGLESTAVYSSEEKIKTFNKPAQATKYIEDLIRKYATIPKPAQKEDWNATEEDPEEEDMKDPALQSLYERKSFIKKTLDVIEKAENALNTLGDYQSGENSICLKVNGDKYTVLLNGAKVLETSSVSEAVSKFYSQVNKLILATTHNKDIALGLFGEKVVQTNRKAIPMLNNLGKSADALWLQNQDVLKFISTVQGTPTPSFQDEDNQGTDQQGVKPSRDLEKPSEVKNTYQTTHHNSCQEPIEQT